MTMQDSLCSAAVKLALDMSSPLILCLTATGTTARLLAKYRPPQCIFAITADPITGRQLQCVRGVQVFLHTEKDLKDGTHVVLMKAIARAKELNIVKDTDQCVCLHGQDEEGEGQTSMMKVVVVGDAL